jgi:hypothetical protein
MALEYRSTDGILITENQLNFLNDYEVVHKEEAIGIIKRIDVFENKSLASIEYFIESNENEIDIVDSLSNLVNRSVLIKTKQILNNYSLITSKQFSDRILRFKTNVLYDIDDNVICFQYLDLNTNEPIHDRTNKYLYKNGDMIIEADYKLDGSLDSLIYMPDYDEQYWEGYNQNNFSDLQAKFTENLSYYLTATLLL